MELANVVVFSTKPVNAAETLTRRRRLDDGVRRRFAK
jgi:hypothetical protein